MLTETLTSYRLILKDIPLWDAAGLMHWLEDVSFWLARVPDDGNYHWWALSFAMDLQVKTRKPIEVCLGVLESHIVRAMAAKGVKR